MEFTLGVRKDGFSLGPVELEVSEGHSRGHTK